MTFALSIDYQVFLLTRMREEYAHPVAHIGDRVRRLEDRAGRHRRRAIMVAVFVAFALRASR